MCANIMWKIGPVACAVHRGRYAANLPESLQRLARVMAKLLLSRIFVSPLLRPIHFTLAAPILLVGCATPQGDGVASASTSPSTTSAPQLSEATLREVTTRLASDEFEGRSPGTIGEERTIAYLIEQFRAAGLQPGNNGSWTQDVPLVEVTASNVSPLTFTTPRGVQSLAYGEDYVAGSYRFTPQTRIANSDVVFVGYGINAPERGWNDYAGVDVRGKTVVILVNDPDWQVPTVGGQFNGRAMTYYGRWTYKFEEAARQGAAAAIIVHDTEPAAYGWNVVRSSWTGAQYYADAANGNNDETQANAWMQLGRAQALFSAAGQDFDALRERARQPGFRAVPLTGVQANLSFDNGIRRTMSHNVIGILPGRTRPNEYVLYSGHWDHLGRCEANAAGDDICNGAVDNATGTAGLVTAGARTCPRRRRRPQPRVPCGHGRGKRPARLQILCGKSGVPAGADSRRFQHGCPVGGWPCA